MSPKLPIDFNATVGQTFGALTILSVLPINAHGKRILRTRCECGNEISISGYNILNGNSRSCGCGAGRQSRYDKMPDDKLILAYTENVQERAKIEAAFVARGLGLPAEIAS